MGMRKKEKETKQMIHRCDDFYGTKLFSERKRSFKFVHDVFVDCRAQYYRDQDLILKMIFSFLSSIVSLLLMVLMLNFDYFSLSIVEFV